jgi:hypothetical protein
MGERRLLLVGDNPFHGISHLSQDRAAQRGRDVMDPEFAANLVAVAMDNGADGFMFTASENTLAILRILASGDRREGTRLYAIVPYAYEFVRMAVLAGGVPGLAKHVGKQIVVSGNWSAITNAFWGALTTDPSCFLKSYLSFETSRIRSAAGKKSVLASVMLHELVTDMALALDMKWLVETHIESMLNCRVKPGFETRNLPYLVRRFEEWGIDFRQVAIAAPFNAVGFQMCPSRQACEEALGRIPDAETIAFSVLAAGYCRPPEAAAYLAGLSAVRGVAVGVAKKDHAQETFRLLRDKL